MEFVLVVPREALFPECAPHGFQAFGSGPRGDSTDAARAFERLVQERGFFVERDHAERTPTLKQVIPYALVVTAEGVLLTRRLGAGSEARLHQKLSIGIGGHVEPCDADAATWSRRRDPRAEPHGTGRHPLAAATERELHEELAIQGAYSIATVGLLNDDSNPVGAVHVGVVQIVTVDGTVAIRETEQLDGRPVSPAQLRALRAEGANYETWSALLLDHLDELLPHSLATVPTP